MDFSFTKEQKVFREEVQQFLEDERENGTFEVKSNYFYEISNAEFSRKLAAKGWIGMTWPKEFGGAERSYIDRTIMMEELLKYQAPAMYHLVSERQIAPSLMHLGSDRLKKEFLSKIINAEISFCIGLSEPGAGSDAASVSTTAIEEDDHFIVNGQKTWTTHAHHADYIWLLAVTDPGGKKYKNLSEIIVDLNLPGVTVRPVYNMAGMHSFNEVFFDNVRVPKKYLVGEKNRGFYQMMSQVDYERAGVERLMQNYPLLERLRTYVKGNKFLSKDSLIRDQMAQIEIEFEIGRLICYRVAWVIDQGKIPNRESAISKAFCNQFEQKLADTATQLLGQFGQVMPALPETPLDGEAAEAYLFSPTYTLMGGTTEILKSIIATRVLGLTFNKKR